MERVESSAAPQTPGTGFRGDIEGLRAIAVVAVVLYHAHLGPFSGGFVGVDVFFVVSGYLITTLLAREINDSGRIGLASFWARRARRLLPASLLVVAVTLLLSRVVLDPLTQRDATTAAFGATFFAANFVFAAKSGYLAAQATESSPLLHYWSLGVEEQFYVIWPVFFALICYYLPAGRRKRAVRIGIGAIWCVSLAFCVLFSDRSWAFFHLPTRAWELATGGLIALGLPFMSRISRQVRGIAAWIALGVLGLVMLQYRFDTMTYPGWAAMTPVMATAVLVAVCDVRRNVGPSRALAHPVLQWIGARSYSLYLWHWPLLVLAQAQWGSLSLPVRMLIVAVSVLLAHVCYTFVENPIRHHRGLAASSQRSLQLGGAMLAVAGAMALVSVSFPTSVTGSGTAAAEPQLATAVPSTALVPVATSAAPAVVPPNDTASGSTTPAVRSLREVNYPALAAGLAVTQVPSNLDPSLDDARSNQAEIYTNGCHLAAFVVEPKKCEYGNTESTTEVLLFGDSHAAQWFPALEAAATAQGWKLVVMTKSGCPTAAISQNHASRDQRCDSWRASVVSWVEANTPDLVLMSARAYGYLRGDVWTQGLTDTLGKMYGSAGRILVLGDTPEMDDDVPACLAKNLNDARDCLTPRDDAINLDVMAAERAVTSQYGAVFEPTTDWVCTMEGCPVIVGNVLMYRDSDHLTTDAVLLLQPYLEAVISETLNGSASGAG
jgi:peptidoglycan/LPS O-acetylase OafA/YrhL